MNDEVVTSELYEFETEFEIIKLCKDNYIGGKPLISAIRFIDEKLNIDLLFVEDESEKELEKFTEFDDYINDIDDDCSFPYSEYITDKGLFLLPNKWTYKFNEIFEKKKFGNVPKFLEPYIPKKAKETFSISFNHNVQKKMLNEEESGNRHTSVFILFDEHNIPVSDPELISKSLDRLKSYHLSFLSQFNYFMLISLGSEEDFILYKTSHKPHCENPYFLHHQFIKKCNWIDFNKIAQEFNIHPVNTHKEVEIDEENDNK